MMPTAAKPVDRHAARNLSDLSHYFSQIRDIPVLSKIEQRDLIIRLRAGDDSARDRLVSASLKLVVSIAKRFQNRGLSLDDLIQEGNIGLMEAVKTFDPDRDVRFSTHATTEIKCAIQCAISQTSEPVPVPTHLYWALAKWRKTVIELTGQLKRSPTFDEVAAIVIRPKSKVTKEAVTNGLKITAMKRIYESNEQRFSIENGLPDHREDATIDRMMADEIPDRVFQCLSVLSHRNADILRMRFGVPPYEPMTFDAISQIFGITKQGVQWVECRSMAKLRREAARCHA